MNSMMGIIKLDSPTDKLKELCEHRPVGSLPIAGRYHVIDFALSNMANAGMTNVGILLSEKASSIFDHLRSGKDWDLARHREGLYYMPNDSRDGRAPIGNLSGLYNNLAYIERTSGDYVLMTSADSVFNADYNKLLEYHQSTGADITLLYYKTKVDLEGSCSVLKVAETGLVKDIARQPRVDVGCSCVLGVYLMTKATFVDMVRKAFEHGGTDLMFDGIIRRADEYTIYAYEHKGYVARINSVPNYYKANMDMATPEIWEELFMGKDLIYTHRKDAVPVQLKATAKVSSSLIANGCEIRGEVSNSVLCRAVKVAEGAVVKNCILMHHVDVGEGAVLENVICGENVIVSPGKSMKGADNYSIIIGKGAKI